MEAQASTKRTANRQDDDILMLPTGRRNESSTASSCIELLSKQEIYTSLHALDKGSVVNSKQLKQRKSLFQFYEDLSAANTHSSSVPAHVFERQMEQKGLSLACSPSYYYNDRNKKKRCIEQAKNTTQEQQWVKKRQPPATTRMPTQDYLRALNDKWNAYARKVLSIDNDKSNSITTLPQHELELRGALARTHPNDRDGMILMGETKRSWVLVSLTGSKKRVMAKADCASLVLMVRVNESGHPNRVVLVSLESKDTNR